MSMSNTAAQHLQRQILSGVYQTGHMLPGQRDLAETMGISRASLREALSMLEALGFIRTVPGKGTLVTSGKGPGKSGKASKVSTKRGAITSSTSDIPATLQLRFVIEPAAAALAARGVNVHATARLWNIQARLENALKNLDLIEASQADLEFHQLIAELSGNPDLQRVLRDFSERISHSLRLPFADHARIWEPCEEHRLIAAAISLGDADGARAAMQTHLRNSAARAEIPLIEP
ncbi:FCD domain-containing protein [Herbaspirillum sp. RTI4]|uniref:FadR/GntR family transcriptional regulator n=1 Tax=Herbaspirillum sp. RTI4 TaxID=3048640 RepID=UPI002AB36E7C|nr:FCD domain-containing protein [Herbaspirillum sp. RTI4]MDY7577202.1 FCD domain-containing protein [Herbaspirillum sp. RTI4]MEA9980492.1 FCD domain-containing protein [Herbaspirillum sp. RTI4]